MENRVIKRLQKGILVLFAFCLLNSHLFAQLNRYDNSWHQLYFIDVSGDKQWITYRTAGQDGNSSTSVKHLDSGRTYSYANGSGETFSGNSNWFLINTASGVLNLSDLKSGRTDTLSGIKYRGFSAHSGYLIAQTKTDTLKIINLKNRLMIKQGLVKSYVANPVNESVAVVLNQDGKELLYMFDLEKGVQTPVPVNAANTFSGLAWNKKGDKISFLFRSGENDKLNMGLYDLKSKSVKLCSGKNFTDSYPGTEIAEEEIIMDATGKKVFFYAAPVGTKKVQGVDVEIWGTLDPVLYSRRQGHYHDRERPWLYVWYPYEGKTMQLGTKELPHVIFNPSSEFGINYNPLDYEPQFHLNQFVDLYALNLENGKRKRIVRKQYNGSGYLSFSPKVNALAYFRDGDWWVYNIPGEIHLNLTDGLSKNFQNDQSPAHTPEPYGLKGWSKDGKYVYVYDEYDVWKFSVDGRFKQKLTAGRKKRTVFRLVTGNQDIKTRFGSSAFDTFCLDDENGLLLSAVNTGDLKSGYYRLREKSNLEEIVFKDRRVTNLHLVGENSFVYQEESFTEPPVIMKKQMGSSGAAPVFRSNKDWGKFKWPKRELIHYGTQFADSLKGVLIYPVNFSPEKKYPVVVHIYEKQHSYYHRFVPPAPFNEVGFNVMAYALDDYFVLLPDIEYQRDSIGISATSSVNSAIDKALLLAPVDPVNIGLIGHSLGGYETAFILTQTNRFAAAVAGSGIYNLVSFYFGLYNLTGHSEVFRVEQAIWRMKSSFFENPAAYLENSPIHHFANIETPLLLWTGKNDLNVDPRQSMEGYMALRRLQKKGIMYLYEKEGHVLMNKENQKDLAKRIKTWFDHYLKD